MQHGMKTLALVLCMAVLVLTACRSSKTNGTGSAGSAVDGGDGSSALDSEAGSSASSSAGSAIGSAGSAAASSREEPLTAGALYKRLWNIPCARGSLSLKTTLLVEGKELTGELEGPFEKDRDTVRLDGTLTAAFGGGERTYPFPAYYAHVTDEEDQISRTEIYVYDASDDTWEKESFPRRKETALRLFVRGMARDLALKENAEKGTCTLTASYDLQDMMEGAAAAGIDEDRLSGFRRQNLQAELTAVFDEGTLDPLLVRLHLKGKGGAGEERLALSSADLILQISSLSDKEVDLPAQVTASPEDKEQGFVAIRAFEIIEEMTGVKVH